MYWFTADHHFGHNNIIKFCNRPFSTVEEMDEELIRRWNEKVKPLDTVYYLGDFTLGNYKQASKYIHRLNGEIYFINGSHDKRWILSHDPEYVWDYMQVIDIPGARITLCHYAMRTWDRSHYGSYHLYGHSHGNLPGYGYSMDVGVDTNDYYPYSFNEIIEHMDNVKDIPYTIYGKKE